MAIKFNLKPTDYGSAYQDMYTVPPKEGGGGGGGKGGGGGRQNGGNFAGNGDGKNDRFRQGKNDGADKYRMNMMLPESRDIFGMTTGQGMDANQLDPRMNRQDMALDKGQQTGGPDIMNNRGRINVDALAQYMGGNGAEALSRGNPKGGIYGGMLSKDQQQGKAMLYALNSGAISPNALHQMMTGDKQSGYDPKQGYNQGIGDTSGVRLSVDDYGGVGRGMGANDMDAGAVMRQIERGRLAPPPPPPRRMR